MNEISAFIKVNNECNYGVTEEKQQTLHKKKKKIKNEIEIAVLNRKMD